MTSTQTRPSWIGSVVALRFNSILKPSASNDLHSLFVPRLVEANYRTDKTVANPLEEVFAQFNAKGGSVAAFLMMYCEERELSTGSKSWPRCLSN